MRLFKKLLKLATALILLPLALFLSVYSLDQQGFFQIDSVDIRIEALSSQKNYISSKVKQLQLKLNSIKGISLWKVPLSQLSKTLTEEKWIKSFQIARAWPSGIVLEIEPDLIEILVISQEGMNASTSAVAEIRPITKSGNILEKIKSSTAPNTVVTYDAIFLNNQKIREGALSVMNSLPASGSLSAATVSEIGYDKKEGYWIKLLQSETKVNFGDEQFEIKAARISQVINYLDGRNLKARVIDANLSKKVLVRLQQTP